MEDADKELLDIENMLRTLAAEDAAGRAQDAELLARLCHKADAACRRATKRPWYCSRTLWRSAAALAVLAVVPVLWPWLQAPENQKEAARVVTVVEQPTEPVAVLAEECICMEPEAVAVAINIDETAEEPAADEIPPWLLDEEEEHALVVTDAVYTSNPPPVPQAALAVNELDEEAEWGEDAEELGSGLGAPVVICTSDEEEAADAIALLPAPLNSDKSAGAMHKGRGASRGRRTAAVPRMEESPPNGVTSRLRAYGTAILEYAAKAHSQP